jgi:hypothetical protein
MQDLSLQLAVLDFGIIVCPQIVLTSFLGIAILSWEWSLSHLSLLAFQLCILDVFNSSSIRPQIVAERSDMLRHCADLISVLPFLFFTGMSSLSSMLSMAPLLPHLVQIISKLNPSALDAFQTFLGRLEFFLDAEDEVLQLGQLDFSVT